MTPLMDRNKALAVNFSQFLFAISMFLLIAPNYDNLLFIALDVLSIFFSGLILFTSVHIQDKYFIAIIYTEAIAVGLLYYFTQGVSIYVLIIYLLLVAVGIKYNFLAETMLVNFLILTLSTLVVSPNFGTDGMMLSYYAAYLFLHGENPYNPALTANIYSVFHLCGFIPIFGTPLSTGGVVTRYDYPALQMLILIPSVIFNINPNFITVTFYFLVAFLLYAKLRRVDKFLFLSFLLPYLFNINYRDFSAGGVTTLDWVFFVLLSLFSKDVKAKGVFYGLALSLKQTPFALLPFYLISIYKEEGKRSLLKFIIYTAISFLAINGYFIFLSPEYYFQGVLYPIVAPLIGISMGLSMIAIAGFFYIYPLFFTLAIVIVTLTEVYFFWKYYNNFKDSWVFFPYFIFFVNYRALWNYFMSWPILGYALPNGERKRINAINFKPLAIPVLLLVSLGIFFHFAYTPYYTSINVKVLHICEKDGEIYGFLLNVSYYPKSPSLPNCIKPYFRIFPDAPSISANGYIFSSNATVLKKDSWEIVKLYPPYEGYYVPAVPLEVEAYYCNLIGITSVEKA
jgi:uncharacterized membrane protein